MFSEHEITRIRALCDQVTDRLREKHIGCFQGMEKPLLLISEQYPGVWLEHVYDSVMYASLFPERKDLARNTVELFLNLQTPEGQYPCYIWDPGRFPAGQPELVGYWQTQECVSFLRLCAMVCRTEQDPQLLERVYRSGCAWDGWIRKYRMTRGLGLPEVFCGYDTGHDNSGRLEGISCPDNYRVDGKVQNAAVLPPEDGITPMIAVDLSANLYATERTLANMAEQLGQPAEADRWRASAAALKQRLFALCLNRDDAFFYDVDKQGCQRRYRRCTVFNLFQEHVLDPREDGALIGEIRCRYMENPKEFASPYPYPSMSMADPNWRKRTPRNCWGYFSQALTALRCTLWMDDYGMSAQLDRLCECWLRAWTDHYETLKFGQELDPVTGEPSDSSEWYSSCMLFYLYGARRLGLTEK